MTSSEESIEILIMGKTGNGKSATGNSILGRHAFVTSPDAAPPLWYTQNAFMRTEHMRVRVVEAPGMCHTARGEGGTRKEVCREFGQVFYLCREGIDVMLLVVRFGVRFTQEDMRVVNTVKKVFGEDFIRKRCILVFTMGEMFDLEFPESDRSFHDWIMGQQGHLRKVIEECNHRCVLFYNNTEDKMDGQRNRLFSFVQQIKESEGVRHNFMRVLGNQTPRPTSEPPGRDNASDPRELRESIGLLQDSLNIARTNLKRRRPNDEEDVERVNNDIETVRIRVGHANGLREVVREPGHLTSLPGTLDTMREDFARESRRPGNREEFERLLSDHIRQCQEWMEGLAEMNRKVSHQMELFSDVLLRQRFWERRGSEDSLDE